MRSEKRKRIILTIAILSIVMISTTILYASISLFAPLETKDRSSDNIDEGDIENVSYNNDDLKSSSSPIYIEGNEGWQGFPGQGTPENPYVISNLEIDDSSSEYGIKIENSNVYFKIEHCTIQHSYGSGIDVSNTINGIISGNTVKYNDVDQIILSYCDYCDVSGNIVYHNWRYWASRDGIKVIGSHNTISGNTVDSLKSGIIVSGNYNIVSGNIVTDNRDSGMILTGDHNIFSGNTATENNWDTGITLSGDDNTFSGNTANNNYNWGIYISGSYGSTISGNTANYNWMCGIYLFGNDNMVSGNTANNNLGARYSYGMGIFVGGSQNTVSANIANNNEKSGIELNGDDNTIWGNFMRNNQQYGIYITSGQNNLIYQNSLIETIGWHARDSGTNNQWDNLGIGNYWDTHTSPDSDSDGIVDIPYTWIQGSAGSVDNYPLVESPHNPGKIHIDDSAGNNWEWASTQFWCSGSGTPTNPYIIQSLTINAGGSGNGILIKNSNVYFKIQNCEIFNAGIGIVLSNTNNGIISGNTVSYSQFHGILLQSSNNNIISGNIAHHNWIGIFLSYSNDNTVSGNIVYFNWIGIVLQTSNNNIVSGNVAMYLHGYGLRLIGSNNNIISENVAVFISEYGIHLNYSSYNTGTGNILRKTGTGKYYEDSKCDGNDIGYS